MNLQEQLNFITRMHQLIKLKATGTPEKFAERLDISVSTLYRLIYKMKEMDFPIIYDKQRECYCYEKEVSFIFEVRFVEGGEKAKRKDE